MPDMITVSKEEWDEIQSQLEWLQCLEAAGVDNWEGFDYACEMYSNQQGIRG